MANTPLPVPVQEDDYALMTGVVRWSLGQALLTKGQRWEGDERLLAERPDLFGTRFDARRPEVTKKRCLQCNGEFIPPVDSGRAAVYCSKRCKSTRETLLRRAARVVSRKSWPSMPRNAADFPAYLDELDGLLGLTRLLIVHINGRMTNEEPREPDDQIELKKRLGGTLDFADKTRLLWSARGAFTELHQLRGEAFTQYKTASLREREINDINERNRIMRATWDHQQTLAAAFDDEPDQPTTLTVDEIAAQTVR